MQGLVVSPTIEARMPPNCRGVAFELSFTSHGTSCGGAWVHEDGSMPTNAVFGLVPIVWKGKYGQDLAFLSDTCYPLMLAAPAVFTVAAVGKNLRYQWQKNRADIPGATSPTYTTPATNLWDLGSAYRCVVSNDVGSIRSEPGILNPSAAGN